MISPAIVFGLPSNRADLGKYYANGLQEYRADKGIESAGVVPQSHTNRWMTIVIGSGCTSWQFENIKGLAEQFCNKLVGAAGDIWKEDSVIGQRIEEIVSDFANDLITDRLRAGTRSLCPTETQVIEEPEIPDYVVDLFIISAILTNVFYAGKAVFPGAPKRSGNEDLVSMQRGGDIFVNIEQKYLEPLKKIITLYRTDLAIGRLEDGQEDRLKEIASLFPDISSTVKEMFEKTHKLFSGSNTFTFAYSFVETWSELAWISFANVILKKIGYPGWRDFILYLGNRCSGNNFDGCKNYPWVKNVGSEVAAEVARRGGGDLASSDVHDAIADVIWSQVDYRKRQAMPYRFPVVSSFVTSFDLEFERALFERAGGRRGVEGSVEEIAVVFPVYLIDGRHVAHTCWIVLKVHDMQSLRNPTVDSMAILSKLSLSDVESLPVVVRLMGCPSISLSNINEAGNPILDDMFRMFRDAFDSIVANRSSNGANIEKPVVGDQEVTEQQLIELNFHKNAKVCHAIIANEHEAMVHNAVDLFGLVKIPDKREEPPGLPAELFRGASINSHGRRFWALFGVQMADSAVRQRVGALFAALDRASNDMQLHNNRGIAINECFDGIDIELLSWSGLDTIKDTAENAIDDLIESAKLYR